MPVCKPSLELTEPLIKKLTNSFAWQEILNKRCLKSVTSCTLKFRYYAMDGQTRKQ